jgi:hypothetical protein
MKRLKFLIPLMGLSLYSCSQFATHRSYLSEMEEEAGRYFNPSEDFPVVAGDTGKNWISDKERRSRTPASEEDMLQDRTQRALEKELTQLENAQSDGAFKFYEKHKNKLQSTSEKIYFLQLPYDERKEYLEARGVVTQDKSSRYSPEAHDPSLKSTDILMGMKKDDVVNFWGNPVRVEVAGNPSYENERWAYQVNGATKYIYFESGEVQGWE